jgi:hypothetical protein
MAIRLPTPAETGASCELSSEDWSSPPEDADSDDDDSSEASSTCTAGLWGAADPFDLGSGITWRRCGCVCIDKRTPSFPCSLESSPLPEPSSEDSSSDDESSSLEESPPPLLSAELSDEELSSSEDDDDS